MADQVPEPVKHERLERLVEVVQRIAAERNAERVGRVEAGPRGRPEPDRPDAAARPNPSEHDGGLHRNRRGRRPRRRRDRGVDLDDASRPHRLAPCPPDRRSRWSQVIAVFGPTASGKTAVAETIADRLGTEVVSCDALQVYRGLPILTNQPAARPRSSGSATLDEEMSVGAYATLAHAAIDERVATRRDGCRERRNRPLPARGARGHRCTAAAASAGVRERILAEVDADPAGRARPSGGSRSTRGRGRARQRHAAPGARARAGRGRASRSSPTTTASGRAATRHPTLIVGLDVPADELERRIVVRTERDVRRRVSSRRCGQRSPRGCLPTAAKALGLDRDRDPSRSRGTRADRRSHPPLRRLSAQVDAAHPRPR